MRRSPANSNPQTVSTGFTLVEMLVATGLVALIMMLFAQIYGSAVSTITDQRALANNDQRARNVATLLRSDLANLTYRQAAFPYGTVQGIVPIAPGDELIVDPVNQRGYLYISENNSNDNNQIDDVLQFTAMVRVGQRGDASKSGPTNLYTGGSKPLTPFNGTNEPERDDGDASNEMSVSRAAEIAYFCRNGTLYRRVLLLRDPPDPSAATTNSQPTLASGATYYSLSNPNYTVGGAQGEFYQDFDYSATRRSVGGSNYLWFHSLQSLDNHLGLANMPLGVPANRFGFNPANGATVEFDSTGQFFGRYTKAEMADGTFGWPGRVPTTNPFTRPDLTLGEDGRIEQYNGDDTHLGEEVVLTNVDAFDVDIFDEGLHSTFINTPTSNLPGLLGTDLGTGSGNFSTVTTFDTWHPSAGNSIPWRDRRIKTFATWGSGGTASLNAAIVPDSLAGAPAAVRGPFVYVCTKAGQMGTQQPVYPLIPGTVIQDGTSEWTCVDNRVPLKGIQIVIRYRDTQNDAARYVSVVHSFVE
ncbi:PulJ/GspJ family protein [Planctomicrobium sp. SH664]|uniref:PulJ/GspJ family protein n=1 Tax=Planctomicrobium sp. SH664 TaxID=3448125 RepID=UPI003F5C2E3D